jgi:hypothetical protein
MLDEQSLSRSLPQDDITYNNSNLEIDRSRHVSHSSRLWHAGKHSCISRGVSIDNKKLIFWLTRVLLGGMIPPARHF